MDTNVFGCNYAVSRCNKTWAKWETNLWHSYYTKIYGLLKKN
jgi:hypothetical protein